MIKGTAWWRIFAGVASVAGLCLIFVFQSFSPAAIWNLAESNINQFIINRIIRFFLNDLLAIALIWSLFAERKYVLFAIWVQLVGMFLFLIPYLIIKLQFPTYNGPLLNFIHRLILNPTLLLLLIPAFYFQKRQAGGDITF